MKLPTLTKVPNKHLTCSNKLGETMTRTDNHRRVFITNLLSLYVVVGVWILCVLVDLPTSSSINYYASAFVLQQPSTSTTTYGEARRRISSTSTTIRLFQSSKSSQKKSSSISSPTIKTKVNNNKGKNSSIKSNTSSRSKTQFIPAAAKTANSKSPSSSSSKSSSSSSSDNNKKKSWFSYSDSVAASSSQASTSKSSSSTPTISPPPPPSTGTNIDETEDNNKKPLFDDDLLDEEPYDVATRLLGLLLQRREDEVDKSFDGFLKRLTPSYWTGRQRQAKRIESLIEQIQDLVDVRKNKRRGFLYSIFGGSGGGGVNDRRKRVAHTYDPSTCLIGGGFFCTLYFYTPNDPNAPDPLWEQLSFKKENVKGQQYYERNDFREAVINYSEVWGPDLYITAEGTFRPVDFVTPNVTSSTMSGTTSTTKGSWPSFGGGNNGGQDMQNWQQAQSDRTVPGSQTLRTCPDIFQVDATGGSIHCETLGIQLPLPIVGGSNLVVVYADPRLRILLSPISSETAFGNWEESGLVVVQVRSDLALNGGDLRERWVRRQPKDDSSRNYNSGRRDYGYEGGSLDLR